jgi:para-nitrobenzyl esterase
MQCETRYGVVSGIDCTDTSGTLAWLGIPYAKPPVGELRWKAPQEPDPWSGARDATAFGPACLQIGRIYGPGANNRYDASIGDTLGLALGSEDCLTLNIWRPSTSEADLPVLFFIHGGSGVSGYTADPVYDGARLAATANAVVVTANYRLGPFGYFRLPQLAARATAAEASGNFALLDNLQALTFVSRNIGRFGGDTDNVTVMGQSAGAIQALALLVSPLAAGLFQKTIALSGGLSLASNLPQGSMPTLYPASANMAQATRLLCHLLIRDGRARDFADAETCLASQSDTQVAAYLRSVAAVDILATQAANNLSVAGPIPDGVVLPADPIAAIVAGRYNRMPVLLGNTADEGKLFAPLLQHFGGAPGFRMSDAERFAAMFDAKRAASVSLDDVIDPAYLPADAPVTGWNAKTKLLTHAIAVPNRNSILDALKSRQPDVWHFQFDWAQEPAPWNVIYGAAHGFDLPFLFGNFGASLFANTFSSEANAPGRLALSAAMGQCVAALMRHGDPNHADLGVAWSAWPATLHFDASLTRTRITLR